MRKGDEDWVKKCIEYRVEGRRPFGRPRKTWLESVEADMAELAIDKEDVHVSYRKMDYKPIMYIQPEEAPRSNDLRSCRFIGCV